MILFSQDRCAIWNFDDISRVHIGGTGQEIRAVSRNGNSGNVGKYRDREQAVYVMGMLEASIASGDDAFAFPLERELEHAKQHGAHGGGSEKMRHGGS